MSLGTYDDGSLNHRVTRTIRAEMARCGLTQVQLGQLLGWGQNAISRRLTGKSPITLDEAEAIARVLGYPLEQLLFADQPQRRRRAS